MKLTNEQYSAIAYRMTEEHRKYADRARPWLWAEIAARKVVSMLSDLGSGCSPSSPGLTVDEVMKVAEEHLPLGATRIVRARLEAIIKAKQP